MFFSHLGPPIRAPSIPDRREVRPGELTSKALTRGAQRFSRWIAGSIILIMRIEDVRPTPPRRASLASFAASPPRRKMNAI